MGDMVYLNGEFVPAAEAKISVFDHGFLYGDGIFETMRAYDGRIFMVSEHLDRLYSSAKELELNMTWSRGELTEVLARLVSLNGDNQYIRLTVTRGPGPVGIDPRLCPEPTITAVSKEININERLYREGAQAVFVETPRNLAAAARTDIKSLNFLNNILAKQEVVSSGADEGFMLNYKGQVTEGTVSNVFMVRDQCLLTPSPACGLLEGIARMKVMEIGCEMGWRVEETILSRKDLLNAEEVFYTNSGSEVVPVVKLDSGRVGDGKPGKVTLELLKRYRCYALGKA
ncbi:aminotransferase class IV [Phosphitispora fastidiosa]|uniref:aminotransferase class IV n=1 Tax=Phosphitispora fastidiosa TaxID=2837202 RepID=UPI001E29C102|nr:aminotransferase class IV [Phosphitispora fastidiosa]MBU7007512.1 branched-chain amino acid aminotransferase [Phosphitispora fastidiosa]